MALECIDYVTVLVEENSKEAKETVFAQMFDVWFRREEVYGFYRRLWTMIYGERCKF